MTERNKATLLWNIGGCLFALSGLAWTVSGNVPIGMMNIAVGMLFIVIGASKVRRVKQQNDNSKDGPSKS